MALFRLMEQPVFPPPELAEENGLLAVGGDLSPQRLLAAYETGVFPWFSEGQPLLWWSPDPRLVLYPERFHRARSLQKTLRRQRFTVTFDTAFAQVIHACAAQRHDSGTWITTGMQRAYQRLYTLGYAHSVECWCLQGEQRLLAGGLYGVALGGCFFGESMFYRLRDASKVALSHLVDRLQAEGYQLLDCQMSTDHLLSLGACAISRREFLQQLHIALQKEGTAPGRWS
ncbi:leucyl/phenylalanyl-tRNA--protein transferase [Candidatus Magnetaquicoccus inordinatus]|uniref:leucyl/phenylalanyl-tRNA--protein transferase n=1 Tax=Candidatus Magnetaquicoccus inordinatus TaxID=2496818 RepID=UPI00102C0535|nr:leucyl/phenylalanyl-tRNA--protein transferase [Candidatus Magnetaquicoccus inordinatus]